MFGGALRVSSPVRHSSCTHRMPLHAAERTLSAHTAGPFARLPSSCVTILAAKDIYSSRSTRTCRSSACAAVVESASLSNA